MNISIIRIIQSDTLVDAFATASADNAELRLDVRFTASSELSREILTTLARDEILRYVDIK